MLTARWHQSSTAVEGRAVFARQCRCYTAQLSPGYPCFLPTCLSNAGLLRARLFGAFPGSSRGHRSGCSEVLPGHEPCHRGRIAPVTDSVVSPVFWVLHMGVSLCLLASLQANRSLRLELHQEAGRLAAFPSDFIL